MPYHVVAFTMAQVRQGALEFQRLLGTAVRESRDLKVYSVSPFDLGERRRFKDRFGGDVVYFFNDAARDLIRCRAQTCIRRGDRRERTAEPTFAGRGRSPSKSGPGTPFLAFFARSGD